MKPFFDILNGACWTFVYVVAIIQGIKNKTWCIPRLAICQNFSWELLIIIHRIQNADYSNVAFGIQLVWLALDAIILILWIIYDDRTKQQLLHNLVLLILVMSIMFICAYKAGLWEFMAFLINAIMSIAFVCNLKSYSSKWQYPDIAVAKLLGTLAATLGNGVLNQNNLIVFLGIVCFAFDYYYVILLNQQSFSGR